MFSPEPLARVSLMIRFISRVVSLFVPSRSESFPIFLSTSGSLLARCNFSFDIVFRNMPFDEKPRNLLRGFHLLNDVRETLMGTGRCLPKSILRCKST